MTKKLPYYAKNINPQIVLMPGVYSVDATDGWKRKLKRADWK